MGTGSVPVEKVGLDSTWYPRGSPRGVTSRSLKLDDKEAMGQQEAHDTGSTWVQRIVVGPSFSQKCASESYTAGRNGFTISPGP